MRNHEELMKIQEFKLVLQHCHQTLQKAAEGAAKHNHKVSPCWNVLDKERQTKKKKKSALNALLRKLDIETQCIRSERH